MIFGTETGKGRGGGALLDLIQRTIVLSLSRPLFNNTSLHAPVCKKEKSGRRIKTLEWSQEVQICKGGHTY